MIEYLRKKRLEEATFMAVLLSDLLENAGINASPALAERTQKKIGHLREKARGIQEAINHPELVCM
ncbi:MAG: hypothetical protein A2288_01055 [Candidatus Moranbacteria bacterium RIFOXYA12_FULL_44_15]|nr:MAG: hypothetical protein A2288_01055 [Candidatus Moranbacteria bacterium RIFOXYA12_FULL_44_15]OGI34751.1 MAG: hypothetical protein A2259_03245 [Candidatus Moranbacteria bacterium RIFOXYA2_FULL_43_15]